MANRCPGRRDGNDVVVVLAGEDGLAMVAVMDQVIESGRGPLPAAWSARHGGSRKKKI